jgi:hypothetical protein
MHGTSGMNKEVEKFYLENKNERQQLGELGLDGRLLLLLGGGGTRRTDIIWSIGYINYRKPRVWFMS